VEAGLICIFIEPHILNEARVSAYIQAISSHGHLFFQGKKTFKYVILDQIIDYRDFNPYAALGTFLVFCSLISLTILAVLMQMV